MFDKQQLFRWALWTFLTLVLLTYAQNWDSGPFSWGSFLVIPGLSWQIGPLVLLPLVVVVGVWRQWWSGHWTWGNVRVTGPLLALTLVSLAHVALFRQPAAGAALVLCWLTYLAVLNLERPEAGAPLRVEKGPFLSGLFWLLLIVILIQALVGIVQFLWQRDLGLAWLGEPMLDPQVRGVSVVYHDETRWLRAYGINSHPNRAGLKLTALLLLLWPWRVQTSGIRRALYWAALLAGILGLVVTLSRSAWLALAAGSLVYAVTWLRGGGWQKRPWLAADQLVAVGLLALALLGFVLAYGDTITGRVVRLDTPLESRSLSERQRDSRLALDLIDTAPAFGVGLNNFVAAAKTRDPFAGIVHNVPLLIAAEMGLTGVICWVGWLLLPLARRHLLPAFAPAAAVWVAFVVVGLFQPEPVPFNMQGGALWGMAAALWFFPDDVQ